MADYPYKQIRDGRVVGIYRHRKDLVAALKRVRDLDGVVCQHEEIVLTAKEVLDLE